jgi:hypothetical protein
MELVDHAGAHGDSELVGRHNGGFSNPVDRPARSDVGDDIPGERVALPGADGFLDVAQVTEPHERLSDFPKPTGKIGEGGIKTQTPRGIILACCQCSILLSVHK